jgi:7-keto-8-aminopelargonate synthetase-like enzyme
LAILRPPLVAMVTENLRLSMSLHVTKAMVQSTFVPSLISIEAFCIVS